MVRLMKVIEVGCIVPQCGNEYFLAKRSEQESYSNQWCSVGGKVESTDKSVFLGSLREFREETGIELPENIEILDQFTFSMFLSDREYRFTHFVIPMSKNIKPTLNSELSDAKWMTIQEAYQYTLTETTRKALEMISNRMAWSIR